MVDEAKLCSPVHSTFEALLVRYAVRHCCGEDLGPFYWTNAGCRHCSFWCISSICWAYFSDTMVSLGFRKLWWIRQAPNHQTVPVASRCIESTFHHMSQSSQEMVHCCWIDIREDISKGQFFKKIFGELKRYPLIEVFHLFNLLQMPNHHRMGDVELFGKFSCSYKRISFNEPLISLLLTFSDLPLCFSSSRLLSPLQHFSNHHCTICSLTVPGPNELLMLRVISATLRPIFELK